jgi:hypothetical protein
MASAPGLRKPNSGAECMVTSRGSDAWLVSTEIWEQNLFVRTTVRHVFRNDHELNRNEK